MKKKVLFFIPNLSVGGAEKVLVNLLNNLDREKFDITLMVLFGGGVNEKFLKKDITFKACFKKTFRGNSQLMKLLSPKALYKRFIKEHYDIIVSYLEGPTARIASGCTDSGTKLVSWIHCKLDSQSEAAIGFRSFEEAKLAYNRFDKTVFVSSWVRDFFCKTLDFKGDTQVLYNTIETDEVYEKSLETVDDVEFDSEYLNLCSVGKIAEVKAFDRIAEIHKRLWDEGIKNRVYIMGDGPCKKGIEDYLKKNGLDKSFFFLGYKLNPYKYVAKCDIYICSSISEGFSTSVTESVIVGTPVVTTRCSGMEEILGKNNEYGIITDNNKDALYEGVKMLIASSDRLDHYKHKTRERAVFFSKENTVRAVEEMLLSL